MCWKNNAHRNACAHKNAFAFAHWALHAASALAVAVALALVFLVAPREANMGDVQRIFYFHVAAAWTGYLALLIATLASLRYLWRAGARWDALALSSVEIGLVFMTQGILTGSIWAKATWGVWWTWEPRLTTSAVLWAIYAAYLTLRRAIEEPGKRARLAAVYAVLGFVAAPINFMAIRWWRTIHPLLFDRQGGNMTPAMVAILVYCVFAFSLFYASLLSLRLRLEWEKKRIEQCRTLV